MKYILAGFLICMVGCTSISHDMKLVSNPDSTTEVVVYRKGAFHAGAVSMYLGENNKYFLSLRNDEYAKFSIDSGAHLFQVDADASPPSELAVTLEPGAKVCFKVKPNPATLGAAVIPILGNMLPSFVMEESGCPSEEALSKYRLVFNS